MDIARMKRYKDKLELMSKRTEEIGEWKKDFMEDEKSKLACYKAFQEAADAAIDIIAFMVKNSGTNPMDELSNIEFIERKRILNKKLCSQMKKANVLRDSIMHHFYEINHVRTFESMLSLMPLFSDFEKSTVSWLEKQ